MAIDMWSLGCILAELYTGCALLPGEDEFDQLACIIELLGMPPKKLLDQSKRATTFFSAKGHPRYCLVETFSNGFIKLGSGFSPRGGKERKPPGKKELFTALKGCDDLLFIDFLQGCLDWDPESRMTPSAALKHAWFRRRRLPMLPPFTGSGTTPTTTTGPSVSTNASVAAPSISSSSGTQPPNPALNYLPKQPAQSLLMLNQLAKQQQQQQPSSHVTPSRTVASQEAGTNGSTSTARTERHGAVANGTTKQRPPITSSSEESMATVFSNPRYYQRNESIVSNGSIAMSTSMTSSQQQPLPRHPSCDTMLNGNRSQAQPQQQRSMHQMDGLSNGGGSSTMTTSTISNSGSSAINNGTGNGLATTKLPHIQTSTVT